MGRSGIDALEIQHRCYSAVPMQGSSLELFSYIYTELIQIAEGLKVRTPGSRHISTFFFRPLTPEQIAVVAKPVRVVEDGLKGQPISIGGIGTFDDEAGNVKQVYLDVEDGGVLAQANAYLESELSDWRNQSVQLDYLPHVTVCRIPENSRSRKLTNRVKGWIKPMFEGFRISDEISAHGIFGPDPGNTGEQFVRLDQSTTGGLLSDKAFP